MQVMYAEDMDIPTITLPPELLLEEELKKSKRLSKLSAELKKEAEAGNDVILRTAASKDDLTQYFNENGSVKDTCRIVAERVGNIVSHILSHADFNTIAVIGGDTTIGIMKALSVSVIRPIAEIVPGTVLSEAQGGSQHYNLVTKAGGFGSEDTILRIIYYLRENNNDRY